MKDIPKRLRGDDRPMLEYQRQDSAQTLAEGMQEYSASYAKQLTLRSLEPNAAEFFRCHDVVHVMFGCDISLNHELIVKMSSIFGTTGGFGVLKGYALEESKEIYEALGVTEILFAIGHALYLIPRTMWRCFAMQHPWRWDDFDEYLDIPLCDIRRRFGIRVVPK